MPVRTIGIIRAGTNRSGAAQLSAIERRHAEFHQDMRPQALPRGSPLAALFPQTRLIDPPGGGWPAKKVTSTLGQESAPPK